jgi:hypothetical protein
MCFSTLATSGWRISDSRNFYHAKTFGPTVIGQFLKERLRNYLVKMAENLNRMSIFPSRPPHPSTILTINFAHARYLPNHFLCFFIIKLPQK